MAPVALEPLVLLANADKWLTESLESVLVQGGYRVTATLKRQQVLDLARRERPDAILLDTGLDQHASDSFALCRSLRADPSISRATPIILTTAGPALRAQKIDALRAGAWELRGDPLDLEELVLHLGVYMQGKLEVDRLGDEGLVDRSSGLYNETGMARRSTALAAFTARQGLPLARAVFQADNGALTHNSPDRLAPVARGAARGPERRAATIGRSSSKKKRVPQPVRDSTFSSDFIAVASLRQIVSPSPACEKS